MMDPLSELFRHYGSDKGGEHLKAGDTCHNYGIAYHELFKHKRDQVKHVLEIGIAAGHSLRAWRDYFPRAQIYGIDSNINCMFHEWRITCRVCDQVSLDGLNKAMDAWKHPDFDLIVDDGSHIAEHQILTARWLLPYLAEDGLYIIEDIHFDCHPEYYGDLIVKGEPEQFTWSAIYTGHGIGRAHCECGCGEGEQLIMLKRA